MNNYRVYRLDDLEKIVEDIELGGAIGTNAKKKVRQLLVRSEE